MEYRIVGLLLGVTCPLLTFVLLWWTTAAVHLYMARIPINVVIIAAIVGLILGLILDVFFLKRWVKVFYTVNKWASTGIYLALCVIAVAFFMGVPIGTFVLGIGSGVYAGRRQHYRAPDGTSLTGVLQKVGLFAAFVTTAAAVPIGILALGEQGVLELLGVISGIEKSSLQGATGVMIVVVLSIVLFMAQYWFSKRAGQVAFRINALQGSG